MTADASTALTSGGGRPCPPAEKPLRDYRRPTYPSGFVILSKRTGNVLAFVEERGLTDDIAFSVFRGHAGGVEVHRAKACLIVDPVECEPCNCEDPTCTCTPPFDPVRSFSLEGDGR